MVAAVKNSSPHVYQAISAVQGELSTIGIAKNRKNKQGEGYMFRGIDDVYAALSPLLAKNNLVIVPRIIHREIAERVSRNGGPLFYVTVHAEFDFVSAVDGSSHTASTFGEAMDSSDKATNKAMSAAYKYAAFLTFAIPTEGDNDADLHTPEVSGFITEAEAENLRILADDAGADVEKFCQYLGVDSLYKIPKSKHDGAVEALMRKASK